MLPSPIKNGNIDQEEILKSLIQTVQNLQRDHKILESKLIRVTEVCKKKFIKIETDDGLKITKQENKFAKLDYDIENLKKDQVKISDDVTHLETEHDHVTKTIKSIDDALENIRKEIDVKDKHVDLEKADANPDIKEEPRKQCKYDRKGYCRASDNCIYFPSNSICQIYLETGACWRETC